MKIRRVQRECEYLLQKSTCEKKYEDFSGKYRNAPKLNFLRKGFSFSTELHAECEKVGTYIHHKKTITLIGSNQLSLAISRMNDRQYIYNLGMRTIW